jgi:hypothetical protein
LLKLKTNKFQGTSITTRKKPIRGIQNLVIGGVSLYAMGKTLLVQAYPWRTDCTPRLTHTPVAYRPVRHGYVSYPWCTGLRFLPVAYRPVHHGYVLYPWRTSLYASGVFCSSGAWPCTPLTCTPQNFYFVRHGCVFF